MKDSRKKLLNFLKISTPKTSLCIFLSFSKRSLDKTLELMNDRELQLSVIQIALFSQHNIKFDYPHLSVMFKSVSAKNFSQVYNVCE